MNKTRNNHWCDGEMNMKKILLCLFVVVAIFALTGCGSNNTWDIGSKSDIETNNNNDVSLSIKDGTLTDTGATLILKNNSDKLLRYDEVYEIEIREDDKCHKINVELYFNLPLWGVEPNSEEEFELNWENGYGKLSPGEYRIIKNVYFEEEEDQNFYISIEFTIE